MASPTPSPSSLPSMLKYGIYSVHDGSKLVRILVALFVVVVIVYLLFGRRTTPHQVGKKVEWNESSITVWQNDSMRVDMNIASLCSLPNQSLPSPPPAPLSLPLSRPSPPPPFSPSLPYPPPPPPPQLPYPSSPPPLQSGILDMNDVDLLTPAVPDDIITASDGWKVEEGRVSVKVRRRRRRRRRRGKGGSA